MKDVVMPFASDTQIEEIIPFLPTNTQFAILKDKHQIPSDEIDYDELMSSKYPEEYNDEMDELRY
jgi:hypothetical protein